MRTTHRMVANERGVALIMTLMLAMIVASLAIGIIMMMGNTNLITKFHAKEAMMEGAADAGLEWGRDQLNANAVVLPLTGYVTLASGATVLDASGAVIPGFTRSVYAGRSGNTTGQFGVYASIISEIRDARGAVVVRRVQLSQDSFAKYAEFTDTFPSGLCVGFGNVKFGPVHSNTSYRLCSTGPAIFNGPLTVVGSITNQAVGTYNKGFKTGVAPIPMPTPVQLASVLPIAQAANMDITGDANLTRTDPDTRIEFVAIDLDNDGDVTDANEGFFRVFKARVTGTATTDANNRAYVNGRRWPNNPSLYGTSSTTAAADPMYFSPNCGGVQTTSVLISAPTSWVTADSISRSAATNAVKLTAYRQAQGAVAGNTRRCYLGGDEALTGGIWRVTPPVSATNPTPFGDWQVYPGWGGAAPASVVNGLARSGRVGVVGSGAAAAQAAIMAPYLWPLDRSWNINIQGVVYVAGSVAASGNIRGQVLLAATGNIMLDDDLIYVTPPNTTCADMLGYTTPKGIRMADNAVNSPFIVNNNYVSGFDDTPSESYNGVFLALTTFDGENPTSGANASTPVAGREDCPVGQPMGRGCDIVIGGLIQRNAGATASTGGAGWNDQYSYDVCSFRSPPPYFPTTGRYSRYQYYEIDPVGFGVAAWYTANQ